MWVLVFLQGFFDEVVTKGACLFFAQLANSVFRLLALLGLFP
jgi:hypothetical protein